MTDEITSPGIPVTLADENAKLKQQLTDAQAELAKLQATKEPYGDGPSAEFSVTRQSKSGLHKDIYKASVYWSQAKGVALVGGGSLLTWVVQKITEYYQMKGH